MAPPALIDLDVHQTHKSDDAELYPYLASGWQEFVRGYAGAAAGSPSVTPVCKQFGMNPFGADRKDAIPEDGTFAGSEPPLIVDQHLDPFNVQAAILTGGGLWFGVSTLSNPYFAAEVARASNDHVADHWLSFDQRFYGSILLSLQVPEWAAAEIHRHADNPRMVQTIAYANPHAYGFGHPLFDPVHRACADTGRPFAIHSLGDAAGGAVPSALAGGSPSYYVEYHSNAFQAIVTHLGSFIYHGVFERYPGFRLVLVESGISWISGVLTRMDSEFKGLRREVPWCRKLPSEYFVENVTVATQPLDASGPDDPMFAPLDRLGAQEALAFSSDYPHWDTDTPGRTVASLPATWRKKVCSQNASRLYRISVEELA
jgi:predicted TIM-barrel fold metal-dependent hydrolase